MHTLKIYTFCSIHLFTNNNAKLKTKVQRQCKGLIWESHFTFLSPISNLKESFSFVGLNRFKYYLKTIIIWTKYCLTYSPNPLFSSHSGYFVIDFIKLLIYFFHFPCKKSQFLLMLIIFFRVSVVYNLSFSGNSLCDFWAQHKFSSYRSTQSTVVSSQLSGTIDIRSLQLYRQWKS